MTLVRLINTDGAIARTMLVTDHIRDVCNGEVMFTAHKGPTIKVWYVEIVTETGSRIQKIGPVVDCPSPNGIVHIAEGEKLFVQIVTPPDVPA